MSKPNHFKGTNLNNNPIEITQLDNPIYKQILKIIPELRKNQQEILLVLAKSMAIKPGSKTDPDTSDTADAYIQKTAALINLMSEVARETAFEAVEATLKMDLMFGDQKRNLEWMRF